RDTDIRNPDGFIVQGDTVGHADKSSTIRRRDGVLFRGEKMGSVDPDGKIRRPDGVIFRGEEVGQVKGNKVHNKDGIIFSGEEWGYVDGEGNIRQKDGFIFKGRVIGQMRGKNKEAALGYFVLKFKEMEDRFDELKQSVRSAKNKTHYLSKLQQMLRYVPQAKALGDFDGFMNRIKSLERELAEQVDDNRRKKEDIVKQSETLSHSTKWKMAADELKKLQEQWSQIHSAGKEHDDVLWRRFRSAQDDFYRHRSEHFEKENRLRQDNQRIKEQLCSKAESLAGSRDSKAAIENIKELQAEWKGTGPVAKDQAEPLWQRFRSACDRVFAHTREERERKAAEWEAKNRERMHNLHSKQRLCSTAESLGHSSDARSAVEQIKRLQSEWKSIGPVPKDQADDLWERFREACDQVFEHARHESAKKQEEWRTKMQDALERKRDQAERLRESIAHDESNIERWHDTIYNLHDGGRADEIRDSLESKISDVEGNVRSKQDRLSDLEDVIRDIETKLYN
ncbi:MAG: DUF349 domain-containing protein, partial [Pelodictyon phaeoclathratiforme]